MNYIDYMMSRDGRRLPPRNSRGEFRRERRDRGYEGEEDEFDGRSSNRGGSRSGRSSGGRSSGGSNGRGGNRGGDRSSRGGRGGYDRGYERPGGREEWEEEMRRYDDYDDYRDMEYNDDLALDERTLREWMKELENADGSRGAKFTKDQIMPVARQHNLKMKDYDEQDLYAAVNMMYSDYCLVLGSDINLYVKLARAFLEDEDAEVKGAEKLAVYYYCIVEG